MKILREIRRFKNKNIRTKIRLISIFLIMLIISTYAWFTGEKTLDIKKLEANVESWDIQYVVDDETVDSETLLDEEFIMQVGDIYPGVSDYSKNVKVYNMGTKPSEIYVKITSIRLFGQEIIGTLDAQNAIQYLDDGKTVKLFESSDYPFEIGYSYDKKVIQGQYKEEKNTSAKATLIFNINWNYETNQDVLDTEFGKRAYTFYEENGYDAQALEVHIELIARSYLDK